MFPFQLPRLFLRILCQRSLRLREWLRKAPVAFPLFSGGLHCPGVRHRASRRHRAGIPPRPLAARAIWLARRLAETFHFWQGIRDSDRCLRFWRNHKSLP